MRTLKSLAFLALLLPCLLAPAPASAQRSRGGLLPRLFKSGDTTRTAFAKVIAAARRATVEIISDKDVVAIGAIIDGEGYIITKASEISQAPIVRLPDDEATHPAAIVGIHHGHDIALLKIDGKNLPTIEWSDAKDMKVGQWVATVGTGHEPVAVGVVSVPRRTIPKQPAALGISRAQDETRPIIDKVHPNTAASEAGLKPGDLILQVDGKKVESFEQLATNIREHSPGDRVTLRVQRGENTFDVIVELSPFSVLPMMQGDRGAIQNRMGGALSNRRFGFTHVYQHDTVLKPDECGGPLVDLTGKAVAINIARAGRVESYAIPADVVLAILPELKSGKLAPSSNTNKVTPVQAEPEPAKDEPKDESKDKAKPDTDKPAGDKPQERNQDKPADERPDADEPAGDKPASDDDKSTDKGGDAPQEKKDDKPQEKKQDQPAEEKKADKPKADDKPAPSSDGGKK